LDGYNTGKFSLVEVFEGDNLIIKSKEPPEDTDEQIEDIEDDFERGTPFS